MTWSRRSSAVRGSTVAGARGGGSTARSRRCGSSGRTGEGDSRDGSRRDGGSGRLLRGDGRHDGSLRRSFRRQERGRDLPRLALRRVEEPRDDVASVLRRDDLRELDEARQVEATVAEQVDDLGVALDELGRGLPVVGGPLGKAQLPVQEVEQRAVPQLEPPALPIEDRESYEELPERVVLAAEEVGEAGGLFAGGRHTRRVACVLECSWNARIPVLARIPSAPRAPLAPSRDDHGAAAGAR